MGAVILATERPRKNNAGVVQRCRECSHGGSWFPEKNQASEVVHISFLSFFRSWQEFRRKIGQGRAVGAHFYHCLFLFSPLCRLGDVLVISHRHRTMLAKLFHAFLFFFFFSPRFSYTHWELARVRLVPQLWNRHR